MSNDRPMRKLLRKLGRTRGLGFRVMALHGNPKKILLTLSKKLNDLEG